VIERSLAVVGHALALSGAAIALVICFCFMGEFGPGSFWDQVVVGLLAMVPLPIAWWCGRKLTRNTVALGVLVTGIAIAFAFEVFIYWSAFFGPDSRNVASFLLFLGVPMYQLPFLALIVLVAWVVARRSRRSVF
jgi:hypothetical protein